MNINIMMLSEMSCKKKKEYLLYLLYNSTYIKFQNREI